MPKRTPRLHRSDGAVRRSVLGALSGVLGVAALACLGVGLWAWMSPRPEPAVLERGTALVIGASPLFDEGTTVFAPSVADDSVSPADLDCVLIDEHGERALGTAADADRIGSRVADGLAVSPIVEVGRTGAGDRLLCRGLVVDTRAVHVLPTRAAPSSTPLSVVIGGLGLAGIAVLVHPAVRGSGVPF